MIYGGKIVQDFKEGKLDSEGNPLEPSPMERLSSEEVSKRKHQIFQRLKVETYFAGTETVQANWFRHLQWWN